MNFGPPFFPAKLRCAFLSCYVNAQRGIPRSVAVCGSGKSALSTVSQHLHHIGVVETPSL